MLKTKRAYKLSTPKSRSEQIAEFRSVLADAPAPAASDDTDSSDADADVTSKIEVIKSAISDAQAAQAKDPDGTTDPNDVKVNDLLTQLETLVTELEKAQGADVAKEPAGSTDDTSPVTDDPSATKLSVTNTTPVANPVDENGNIDDDVECTNADCGHLASAHEDLSTGDNSGACQMQNCDCPQMAYDANGTGTNTDPEGDDSDGSGDGGGPDNAGGDDTPASANSKLAGTLDSPASPTGESEPSPTSTLAPPETNPAPFVPGATIMGAQFTIPVMVIEGQQTGDGRGIALDALTWGAMPMPLMGLATSTHDPMGFDMNDPSIICGRIDSIERVPGENGTQIIMATGFFLDNDDGAYFADLVEQMGRVGISADIAVVEAEETISGMDEFGWPLFESMLLQGIIQGCTIVPFPAFEGAYIIIGDGTTIPEIPQQVSDTMPVPAVVASGGQLIHYMALEDCGCAGGFDLVASAIPVRPPKAWFENPGFAAGDGRLKEIFVGRGDKRVGGAFACPFTVTDEGEVFGHLAPWGVCHAGDMKTCVTAPHSKTNYAHFLRAGQKVVTAEGDEVNVGVLTLDTGHAPTRIGVNAAAAQAHYDNTGAAFADVVVGEDEYGIWVHGALRSTVDEEMLRRIRASSPSGDWREIGGNLELVACLQVNQPGFPVAAINDGREVALVAAGAYIMEELREKVDEAFDEQFKDVALRAALAPMLEREKGFLRAQRLEMSKAEAKARFMKAKALLR